MCDALKGNEPINLKPRDYRNVGVDERIILNRSYRNGVHRHGLDSTGSGYRKVVCIRNMVVSDLHAS
jgi:hypothetical protein